MDTDAVPVNGVDVGPEKVTSKEMETLLESDSEEPCGRGEVQEERQEERQQPPSGVSLPVPQQLVRDHSCPESYTTNSPDEIRLLAIADSFQRQYSHLYPERKPLLLCPVNEFGVKKFVCTTLRPTPTSFPELFTWEGCASFVADFLSLDPLEPPVELPRHLFSPTSVLQSRRATCLEAATLLCSLLLGVHYDAYCVSGYALRETCLLDQGLRDCPLLDAQARVSDGLQTETSEQEQHADKEPRSQFLLQQEKKKKQEAEAELLKQQLREETGQRPADPLWGLRVHCWVLVLAGSRSIQENFFIDPLTGNSHSTGDDAFLGVESVWNSLSYYVNMQDCSRGCGGLAFDLEDLGTWEPVLFGATSKKQLILDVLKKRERQSSRKTSTDDEEDEEPRGFTVPRSWVGSLSISKKDLETRWPGGQKATRYRKAKLEKFAPYLRWDGLVTRLTAYKDLDCTEVTTVREWYQHRNDHLEQRDTVDAWTTERFRRGRRFSLLVHRFRSQTSDFEHEMEFCSARADHLVRRAASSRQMTEVFEGRADFLSCRHVVFDAGVRLSEPLDDPHGRRVQTVVERFRRDGSKPAHRDVAERVFLRPQGRIEVTYHSEDSRFVPSKRSFTKPRPSTETQKEEVFTPALVSSFQADSSEELPTTQDLYEMLQALLRGEEETLLQVNMSTKELRDIRACRAQEQRDVQLLFSTWTTAGAARASHRRQETERLAAEKQRWLQEKKKDILAPFLIRLTHKGTLGAEDARRVHRDCVTEYKQRLADQADLIQERLDKATLELQEKQASYQENQLNMSKEQQEEHQSYCAEKMLQIHVAKKRLSMHKEAAPQKFEAFDQKVRRDPRLAPHLLG